MKHERANNRQIRRLITYVKDDLDSIDGEMITASKRHIKPREDKIGIYMNNIELLLRGIKNEFRFEKKV